MNKKNIILVISTILCLSIIFSINYVKADSGWDYDYDYDYGGSWDYDYDYDYDSSWGSDWDYDNDWNWSYSNTGGSTIIRGGYVLLFLLIIALYLIIPLNSYKRGIRKTPKTKKIIINDPSFYSLNYNYKSTKYDEISESEVVSKLGMTSYKFRQITFDIYKNIQNAWTEFDYKKLRKYTTDEIYNSYITQLDTLKLKNQKNIMSNIECIDVKIYNIKEENGILSIDVYMNVKMFDYIVNNNGHVIRGTSKRRTNIEYELTFVKSNKKASKKTTICPNCGAKIPVTTGGKCEYCGTVVVIDAKEFVMSRKTCINQRMD